ncbi:MAG: hypothetical protein JHC33_08865 [Ignisphaera sp.]|nr:hypothetical protein [Ignisphaera sp.]
MANGLLTGYFGQPDDFQPNYGLSGVGLQMAQMPAGRGGVAASYDIGQQNLGLFQNAMGKLLNSQGVYSPTQEKELTLQAILGETNPQDANSLAEASRKLISAGMTKEAQSLLEESRKVAEASSKIDLRSAQADYYSGRNEAANKPKVFQVNAKMKLLEDALASGSITQEEYRIGVQNILNANQALNDATIGAKNRSGYDPTANSMQDFGQFTGDPSLLARYLNNKANGAGGANRVNTSATPKTSTSWNDYAMINGITPDSLASMTPEQRQQVSVDFDKWRETTKSVSPPKFNTAMGLTAEITNNLHKDDKASSYLMGAQQLFSEGDVEGARNLVNQAQQAYQTASDNTLSGVNDGYVIRDANKAVEKLNAQEGGVNQIISLLNNPENWNNPKIVHNIASTYLSANSPTSIRALAELEGLRGADSIIQRLEDAMSKMGTGTPTNAEIEQYNSAAKELQSAIKENKLNKLSEKIGQYANSSLLKSDAKVPSFLSSFGVHGASMVSDNAGNRPNGYKTVNKDGDVFVVVNGKVYKGKM